MKETTEARTGWRVFRDGNLWRISYEENSCFRWLRNANGQLRFWRTEEKAAASVWNVREGKGVFVARLIPDTTIDVEADRAEEAQSLSESWIDYHTRSQVG